jgi:hypothetical protein
MSKKAAFRSAAADLPSAGELPAWDVAELPKPVPFGWHNVLKSIGPGIIVLGGSIGTGEWLLGPGVTARFQGQMLWLATLAIFFQSFLNTECIRYALYTGEPIFTGYLRCRPGPKFWSIVYLFCDAGMFFPAFAASIAQLLLAAHLGVGRMPGPEHGFIIMWIGIVVILLCYVLMLFGGKIYNMLQSLMTFKVIWVLLYLAVIDFFLVGWDSWKLLLRGFFWPFTGGGALAIPAGLTWEDWALIAGFAAYAGAGGLSNATFSNYARDKGWGMGSLVGAIPSAVGGMEISLSPLGTVFRPTKEALKRWRLWWRYVYFDQYVIWVLGCFVGMMFPAAMSLKFVKLPEGKINGMQIASMQAQGIADSFPDHRQLFWILTLFCGFLIIAFTQIQSLDHVTRRWTDILWTGSEKARDASGGSVQRIYYLIAGAYAVMNIVVLIFVTLKGGTPFTVLVIQSVTAGFAMVVSALHTLFVNRRFLPKELQPAWWREVGLAGCGIFYLVMTSLAVYGQVHTFLNKR